MKLVSLKVVESSKADSAMAQYKDFLTIESMQHKERVQSFDRKFKRLDTLFLHDIKVQDSYPDLAMVMKIIFTLSHGQASVERGFNDNNVVLNTNQHDDTAVARRFVRNYLSSNKFLPHTAPITQPLIKSFSCAWRMYNAHLEEQKEKKKKNIQNEELLQVENEMKSLSNESDNLEKAIKDMTEEYHKYMLKAEQKNNKFVFSGNALKRIS